MAQRKTVSAAMFLKKGLEDRGITVSKIILFGSQARGNAVAENDLDLVVVSEDFRGKSIFKRAEMIGDAEYLTVKKFKIPIDILLKTPEEMENNASIIARYVKRDGVVVFAA